MPTDAATKLRTEIKQNKNNPYIQVVGEFLLRHLEANPGAADKILNKEKTIGKSLEEMRKAAAKKKVGNCAVLTDQEGFEIVLKYFGLEASATSEAVAPKDIKPPVPKQQKSGVDFDVKLEDLL